VLADRAPAAPILLRSCQPPPAHRHTEPNCFHEPEWPSALEEAIGGSKSTGNRKGQHEPCAALFQCVAHEHRCDCEKAKGRQFVHRFSPTTTRVGRQGLVVGVAGAQTFFRLIRAGRAGQVCLRMDAPGAAVSFQLARLLSWSQAERTLEPDDPCAPDEAAYSPDGVDLTLIRWMLSLTPAERLDVLQDFVDFVMEARARNPQV